MAFNPFFDNIRQNIELGGGRGSGEGIPLKLPRRVRRRVEELPFEWLRDIGRRSGTLDDGTGQEQDQGAEVVEDRRKGKGPDVRSVGAITNVAKIIRKRQSKKVKKHTNSSRLRRSPSSSSYDSTSPPPDSSEVSYSASASKANSKAGSVSPSALAPIPNHSPQLQTASGRPQDTTRESSEGESSGDDFAKALAMQFYKIELGEQRRLMGVMQHHSMESGTVVDSSSQAARTAHAMKTLDRAATVGGFTTNSQGIPSGGLCGPLPTMSTGAPILPTEPTNEADQAGQMYTGTAAARMLSGSVSEGGVALTKGPRDREKAFPFSITAGVEKGDKNRYVGVRFAVRGPR